MFSNLQLSRLFLKIFERTVAHSNGKKQARSNEQLYAQKSREIKKLDPEHWGVPFSESKIFFAIFLFSRLFLEIFEPTVAHSNGKKQARSNEQLYAQKSQEIKKLEPEH